MSASALLTELAESISDERVLRAIAELPREAFVPAGLRHRAYENVALEIDCEQTISQPLVVARMAELLGLGPSDRVLDVGTGSGYHAAVLARLAGEVVSIERHRRLSRRARETLRELGIDNVRCIVGDGRLGWPQRAPYDAINVAAAPGPRLPRRLGEQLADGGRLVIPLGDEAQRLTLVRRGPGGLHAEALEAVRFVPLVADRAPAPPRGEP